MVLTGRLSAFGDPGALWSATVALPKLSELGASGDAWDGQWPSNCAELPTGLAVS